MIRGESPCRTFAVDAQLLLFAIYGVRLDFGYIVANIVEQTEFQFTWGKAQSLFPCTTCQVHEYLTVGKGKIRG
jgi:hypothetical protein